MISGHHNASAQVERFNSFDAARQLPLARRESAGAESCWPLEKSCRIGSKTLVLCLAGEHHQELVNLGDWPLEKMRLGSTHVNQ